VSEGNSLRRSRRTLRAPDCGWGFGVHARRRTLEDGALLEDFKAAFAIGSPALLPRHFIQMMPECFWTRTRGGLARFYAVETKRASQYMLCRMSVQKARKELEEEKQAAAQAALWWVRNGMTLGLGSGTTAHYFIALLGEQVRSGTLAVEGVASSRESERIAREAGITLIDPRRGLRLDLAVDGADEIGPDLNLIKGGGGALLREKAVAEAARYFLVIADSSKRVTQLGAFPLPVEVVPFTLPWAMDRIQELGAECALRMGALGDANPQKPYVTDRETTSWTAASGRLRIHTL
jgi:ribose 5-phosphate isomerase A